MRKKILVAERSDAIRNIAESLLHQNGYDVITSTEANKAKELIITSEPNMVIAGADLKDNQGNYLYDLLEENERTASIPLLLIADPEGRELSFPDEAVLPRPFDPKDFIERVRLFVGGGSSQPTEEKVTETNSFSVDSVDDDFLDAALGIETSDNIDVESSEEMDKTTNTEKSQPEQKKDTSDAFSIAQPDYDGKDGSEDSGKVESLMIMEDGSTKKPSDKAKSSDLSASSKLEISTDQFGISEPPQKSEPKIEKAANDYDWFLKEMKKDIEKALPPKDKETDDTGLEKTANSEGMEPIRPSSVEKKPVFPEKEPSEPKIKDGGVEQFISEFKKEMKDVTDYGRRSEQKNGKKPTEIPPVPAEPKPKQTPDKAEPDLISAGDIDQYMQQLIKQLSEKLAGQIASKINKEELRNLILDSLPEIISSKK
jgi:CheY-like chemotaxis protein